MNLVSGDLYFISEFDVLAGKKSDFYKIGLVKDSRRGATAARTSEHQTGNPRRLDVVEVVSSVSISDLEASMHLRFASRRVLGEWFQMTGRELNAAIGLARGLAGEQAESQGLLERARELTAVASTEVVGQPSSEDRELHSRILAAKVLLKRVKSLTDQEAALFLEAFEHGESVGDFASVTRREGTSFDKKKLSADLPDLYQKFVVPTKISSATFTVSAPAAATAGIDVPGEFVELEDRLAALLGSRPRSRKGWERLHLAHLELLAVKAGAEWDLDLANAALRVRCGSMAGIEGVCSWKRAVKVEDKFDPAAFKAAHPGVAQEYTRATFSEAFAISPMRSYRPKA